ncbi:MAG: hypothetical protein AAF456_21025 [Planctomycetota bacterium]
MRSFNIIATIIVAFVSFQAGVSADMYTDTRTNTEDIVIPAFNQSLGTLESVDLRVVMQAGSTTANGGHTHVPRVLVSTNQEFGNGSGNFNPFNINTLSVPATNHSFASSYAGGGLNFGTFNGTTSVDGGHFHVAQVSSAGTIQDGFFYRLRVSVNPFGAPNHTHTYNPIAKNFNYVSAGELAAFLGAGDLVITDNPVFTSTNGNHNHNINAFNVVSGGDNFSFAPSTTNSTTPHNHSFDPRWSVTATFTYSAIPEPASMLIPVTFAAIAGLRRRR